MGPAPKQIPCATIFQQSLYKKPNESGRQDSDGFAPTAPTGRHGTTLHGTGAMRRKRKTPVWKKQEIAPTDTGPSLGFKNTARASEQDQHSLMFVCPRSGFRSLSGLLKNKSAQTAFGKTKVAGHLAPEVDEVPKNASVEKTRACACADRNWAITGIQEHCPSFRARPAFTDVCLSPIRVPLSSRTAQEQVCPNYCWENESCR